MSAEMLLAARLAAVEVERDEVVQQRNYAMRQRNEERRAKEGNIRHLNAAIVRAEIAEQQLADLRATITALADGYAANGAARDAAGKPAWPNNVARDLRALLGESA